MDLVSGDLELIKVPGNHVDMIKRPNVNNLARRLKDLLDAESGQPKAANLIEPRVATRLALSPFHACEQNPPSIL